MESLSPPSSTTNTTLQDWILVSQINYFLVFFIPFLFLISKCLPFVIESISKRFCKETRREMSLLKEIKSIKEEMSNLSMVDDFAKYSKLKRKLIQFNLSLDSDVGARQSVHQKFIKILTYISYVIMGLIYILTLFYFGHKQPVFIISNKWFYPINYLFAYPTGIDGAISIPIWTILTRSTMTALIKI